MKTEVKILKISFVRCNSVEFDIPSLKIYLQLTKKRKRKKNSHFNYFAIKVIINAKINNYTSIYQAPAVKSWIALAYEWIGISRA